MTLQDLPQGSLVRDAMLHLKRRKGASLTQIRKHLESNYDEKLDATNKKILSSALKGLVDTGRVQKSGVLYKLIRTAKGNDETDVPNRRRPHGYCKTHSLYHRKKGYRHRRRRRRRRRRSRRRSHRRRRRCHRRRRCYRRRR